MRPVACLVSFVVYSALALPLFAGFQSTETYLVAVGRAPGQLGAQIYSTVWATNLTGAPNSFTVYFLKQGQANTSPASFTDTLAPGETKIYENIAESKFGLTSAIGAARIVSAGEILVSERIYNQPSGADLGNTEGFFFAGVPKGFSISSGQSASIQGVNQGGAENFRSNFILVETGGQSTTVNVQVFDANGTQLGQKAYPLQAYEQFQANVGDIVPSIATINGRITATVTGGTGSALLAGAQVANETQDASGFEMSFRDSLLGTSGGTAGVTSLNGLTGALTIAHGANTTVNVNGSTITIDAVAGSGTGLTAVAHDNTLSGSGTVALPLGVVPGSGGITSITHDASLTGAGTGPSPLAIANGQVVRSLTVGATTLHDAVTLAAGSNVTLTPSGQTITIASSGGAGLTLPYSAGVSTADLTPAFSISDTGQGDAIEGSSSGGFGVHGSSHAFYGVFGISDNSHGVVGSASASGQNGVYGQSLNGSGVYGLQGSVASGASGIAGVWGDAKSVPGVHGTSSSGKGVLGESTSDDGLAGNSSSGHGVYGKSSGADSMFAQQQTSASFAAVAGENTAGGAGVAGNSSGAGMGLVSFNGLSVAGTPKSFVEPHPDDPTKMIRYVCLEGPEVGTYFRGSGRIVGGLATVEVPESFRMVTSDMGITVQLTPVGDLALLAVMSSSLDRIVVRGSRDVEFHYMVNGVRKAFPDHEAIQENDFFIPRWPNDSRLAHLPPENLDRLKHNGTLNPDGTLNMDTVRRLGWDKRPGWRETQPATDRVAATAR